MLATYPALYRDRLGEVATTITNDGKLLRMVVRGVELVGDSFEWLEPSTSKDAALRAGLSFDGSQLCAFALDCVIPMSVVYGSETLTGQLHMHLELGDPRPGGNPSLDRYELRLTLTVAGQTFTPGRPHSGWFDEELGGIQAALPDGMFIMCCFACAFSDYHPAGFGYGIFGDLACYRNNKEAALAARTKQQLFVLWNTRADFVQETFLCPQFEQREFGAGYRG